MRNKKDLIKLAEECSELAHIASKYALFLEDGGLNWITTEDDLLAKLKEELADVMAISSVVMARRRIGPEELAVRSEKKRKMFVDWGFLDLGE